MKAEELIIELEKCDPKAEVYVSFWCEYGGVSHGRPASVKEEHRGEKRVVTIDCP